MRVTCGACWASLKVEARLAGSVARCPKCHERIRIPPWNSPAGAHAVVVSEEVEPAVQEAAAVPASAAAPVESSPTPRSPKTEPLPVALRQAAPASTVGHAHTHEEPARHRTRPLPKPAGRPPHLPGLPPRPAGTGHRGPAERASDEPRDGAGDDDASEAGVLRKSLLTPLVPIGFAAGLAVGALLGWLVGRPGGGDVGGGKANGPPEAVPVVVAELATSNPAHSPATAAGSPTSSAFRAQWLTTQPEDAAAHIAEASVADIRVAGVMGITPAGEHFYYPAPPGQMYVEVKAKLKWTGREDRPVTIRLGGQDAGCWLISRDGATYRCLGVPFAGGPADVTAGRSTPPQRSHSMLGIRKRM